MRRTTSILTFLSSACLAGCAEPTEQAAVRTASRPSVAPEDLELENVGCSTSPPIRRAPPEFDDADPSAVRLFHDVLAPYGTWVDDARLGLVWTPSGVVDAHGFVPYATHGRWSARSASEGNDSNADALEYVWVSDLPWGWVTFHYGRWTFAGDRGWAWVPGRKYAGAWVDWRAPRGSEGIVGWGPTPPAQLWRVLSGPTRYVAVPHAAFATPYSYARARDLFAPDLRAHLLEGPAAFAVAHATEPGAPPTALALGIARSEVPLPPSLDRGLQQAWMLATPATAIAVGAGPELAAPPRDRTYVTGGRRWAVR